MGTNLSDENSTSDWVKKLGNQPLPVLKANKQHLQSLLIKPHVDFQSLADGIRRAPGFCLFLFKTAGNALRPGQDPCKTPSHALSLLGNGALAQAIRGLPVFSEHPGIQHCISRAIHAAEFAFTWATFRKDKNPEEIAMAALFQEIAELVLWVHETEHMQQIDDLGLVYQCKNQAAIEIIGCSLDDLNLALAKHWHLPLFSQTALDPINNYQPRPLCAMLASALGQSIEADWRNNKTLELMEHVADHLNCSISKARYLVQSTAIEIARQLHNSGLPLPAHRLIVENSIYQEKKPTLPVTDPIETKTPQKLEPTTTVKTKPNPVQAQAGTAKSKAPATSKLQKTLEKSLNDMQNDTGLQRVFFAILTPDRAELRARFHSNPSVNDEFKDLNINTRESNLFSHLLKKSQAIWVHSGNREKFLPLIPDKLAKSAGQNSFFAMSLFVKNRSIGVFYGDAEPGIELSKPDFALFKQLCQQVANSLAPPAH